MIAKTPCRMYISAWLATFSIVSSTAATLPSADPEAVAMHSQRLDRIDELAREGIDRKLMPGCVVTIGRHGKIVFHRAYGRRQVEPDELEMTTDTVFDMASITKPVATATSVMILVDQGKIRLRDKVSTYIAEFANGGKENVNITQLLTHQAGFVPDNPIADYEECRERAFENIYGLSTTYDPGSRFVYSDVGFVLLDDLIERQSGLAVDAFSKKYVFEPLGMSETGFLPNKALKKRAATTEKRESRWMQGEVHDPRSFLMGGVAGHAGLFSTASNIAIYAQMMLNGGHYAGRRILSKSTVRLMTDSYRIVEGEKVSVRGLGWDRLTGYSSNRGENMSSRAFGHGGFTGTVLWIDPERDFFFIFLSNRVHPDGKGSVNRLAGRMATVAVAAIDDELLSAATHADQAPQAKGHGPVLTGIDHLEAEAFATLKGQRVGLITNQTGINQAGESTITLLSRSPHVKLTALFSPEHGLEGKLDQSIVADSIDGESGVGVFSLYGKTRKPTPEQLADVDTLVFDIQDIGCRFYTYVSTMGLAMEAAADVGKRFVVLDRPNPINGLNVAGPMLDDGRQSFVGFHRLPVRHGMTVGELALMFKDERKLAELDLHVVKCSGWSRERYFDEIGLVWVNPSPNMRSLNEAILYPGIGLWETTNISVGRGTDTPFEVVGAPWVSARQLAMELNRIGLSGVQFTPQWFTPTASKFANQRCEGIRISITDRGCFDPSEMGIAFACVMRRLYGETWRIDDAMRLLCNQQTLDSIKQGKTAETILDEAGQDLDAFLVRRHRYLLY